MRPRLLGQRDRLGAVARLGDNGHARFRERIAEDAAEQGIVLRNQDPDRIVHVVTDYADSRPDATRARVRATSDLDSG